MKWAPELIMIRCEFIVSQPKISLPRVHKEWFFLIGQHSLHIIEIWSSVFDEWAHFWDVSDWDGADWVVAVCSIIDDEGGVDIRMLDEFGGDEVVFKGLASEEQKVTTCWAVVGLEMQSIKGNSMVVFVFIRQGKSILPVQLHEDRLQHNSSMRVIIRFLNVLSSSYFYHLLS